VSAVGAENLVVVGDRLGDTRKTHTLEDYVGNVDIEVSGGGLVRELRQRREVGDRDEELACKPVGGPLFGLIAVGQAPPLNQDMSELMGEDPLSLRQRSDPGGHDDQPSIESQALETGHISLSDGDLQLAAGALKRELPSWAAMPCPEAADAVRERGDEGPNGQMRDRASVFVLKVEGELSGRQFGVNPTSGTAAPGQQGWRAQPWSGQHGVNANICSDPVSIAGADANRTTGSPTAKTV
jgi:hypothetical protein